MNSVLCGEEEESGYGPMCLCMKDHGRQLCERLQQLRLQTALLDLDILIQEDRLRVHKVVMAASSKFFKEQLTKANVLVPVILRLEDFGLDLKREAVSYIVEFVYRGEVLVPGEKLSDVCVAAHSLGVYGLVEFLPNALPKEPVQSNLEHNLNSFLDHITQSPQSAPPPLPPPPPPPSQSLSQSYPPAVDPVLDDALSLLSKAEESSTKLRVITDRKDGGNDHLSKDSQSSSSTDPSRLISVSTPTPAEWSDANPPWASDSDNAWTLPTSISSDCKQQAEGSWTTPAFSPVRESSWENEGSKTDESVVMWNPKPSGSGGVGSHLPQILTSDENMLAIRSGIPLALQQSRKKKKSGQKLSSKKSLEGGRKGDLEVRKDLTLPSAPSDGGDNVFQEEDPAATNYPIVHLDDGDLEVDFNEPSQTKEMEETRTQCLECSMTFLNTVQLRSHVRHAHQTEALLSCPLCKVSGFQGKEAVKIHIYKEHGMGELFRCEECSYETSIKSTYVRHVAEHINTTDSGGKTKMKCSKCVKEFRSKVGLKLHLKQHYDDKLYACSVCEFKTPQRVNLVKHMASKHKKGIDGRDLSSDYKCQSCSFECVAEHQLKSHVLRKHTAKDQMKYRCSSCSYATVERAALDKHVRFKHTKERPFMCDVCGFSTHTLSSMARHKRGHLRTKPHACKMCGVSYADKKRLTEHLLSHSGVKPFSCNFCSYKCRRKDNLAAHIKRVHSVPPKTDSSKTSGSVNSGGSHIVGHVNQDGTIRPVAANPKPPLDPVIDGFLHPPDVPIMQLNYCDTSGSEEIIVIQQCKESSNKDVIVQ